MANQKHSITKNTNEDIVKQIGLPKILVHNKKQTPFEITSSEGRNLIPRVVVTNIMVFPTHVDLEMERRRRRRGYRNGVQQNSDGLERINNGAMNNNNNNNNNHHNLDMNLHIAANCGDMQLAEDTVVRNRELLMLEDPNGRNLPLHIAVMSGHLRVASYLVRNYPQGSYALNRSNNSPIYLAVVHCPQDLDFLRDMLRIDVAGFNAFDALSRGKSIAHAAIRGRNQAMLQIILRYQPGLLNTNERGLTPLSYAASKGFVDIVAYIIQNYPDAIYYRNADCSYPIHNACLGGHVDVLRRFHVVDRRSLLTPNQHGRTILHLAAMEPYNNLMPVVNYLLDDVREGNEMLMKTDDYQRTPLRVAERQRNGEVVTRIRRALRSLP